MTKLSKMDAVSAHRNSELLDQLHLLHTTELRAPRLRRNLNLPPEVDVVAHCRDLIAQADKIERRGKNWYVTGGNAILTVNAGSLIVITGKQHR